MRLLVEESGARYPLTIDPIAQQAYLKPAAVGTTQLEDDFGQSVAISGDTIVVGAPREDSGTTGVNSTANESATDSGAAYVFVRSGGGWAQQAYLKPALIGISQVGDGFGSSVAISGNTMVIGAPGEDSSSTGVNSTPNDFGSTTGGAFYADSGAAYVFVRTAGVWTQQAYLKPATVGTTQAGDGFGFSVAISGDTIVVGAINEDSDTLGVNSAPEDSEGSVFNAGAAYVFARSAGAWTQQAFLKPGSVGFSQKRNGFGWSVAISGDTVAVGVPFEDSGTTGVKSTPDYWGMYFDSGALYVFVRSAGAWTQQAYLKPGAVGATQGFDNFGLSVACAGDTLVVGASREDSSTTGVNRTPGDDYSNSGAAYLFTGLGPGVPDADGDGLLDAWELTFWPNRNDHGPLDDSDGDGTVELLELALGMNLGQPNAGGLPAATNETGYLTMTITKQPGVTYEIQSAGTLLPALPDSFSAASTTVLIDDATTLKVRDNFLIGAPPTRFMRVKVTAAP